MNKNTGIFSVEYYLPKSSKAGKKASLLQSDKSKKTYKILVQDHVKDSVYLIDA